MRGARDSVGESLAGLAPPGTGAERRPMPTAGRRDDRAPSSQARAACRGNFRRPRRAPIRWQTSGDRLFRRRRCDAKCLSSCYLVRDPSRERAPCGHFKRASSQACVAAAGQLPPCGPPRRCTDIQAHGAGLPAGAGVIVDHAARKRTVDLRDAAVENGVEVTLDPRSVELSTIGGMAATSVARLPWAQEEPQTPSSLSGAAGEEMSNKIAAAAAAAAVWERATGVLAPTHFPDDEHRWLDVDRQLTTQLRAQLDASGAGSTVIYYPLVVSLRTLLEPVTQTRIISQLNALVATRQIDGVFLRVQGFGTTKAGPRNLRTYLRAARDLHTLGVPLVGERTGGVGVALAAFGAIGGIESSVTYGEAYDARRLNKAPKGKGFVPPPRVYIRDAMALVSRQEAEIILNRRGFARLRCQQMCCGRDRQATLDDPRRHFIVSRSSELAQLSVTPANERAEHYLTTTLGPSKDNAAQLARFVPSLIKHRDRLVDWHLALQRTLNDDPATQQTTALVPTGRRLRRSA